MSLVCTLAIAQTVYKWTDDNGVVHYSDQPHTNAEKVHVKAVQTYKHNAPDLPTSASAQGVSGGAATPATYQGCAVVQPVNDQSFSNIDSLTVVVQTDPVLRRGDQVFVTLDGQALNGNAATGPQFTISPVDRGTHTVQALVKASDGTVLCQTPGVTFNVQQNSVLNRNNPNNAVFRPH
jgi:hypothetical protein